MYFVTTAEGFLICVDDISVQVVMELGGNAPCIVEDLVPDLDGTISRLMIGGFYQCGQSCIHMQRLYVRDQIYDQVCSSQAAAIN